MKFAISLLAASIFALSGVLLWNHHTETVAAEKHSEQAKSAQAARDKKSALWLSGQKNIREFLRESIRRSAGCHTFPQLGDVMSAMDVNSCPRSFRLAVSDLCEACRQDSIKSVAGDALIGIIAGAALANPAPAIAGVAKSVGNFNQSHEAALEAVYKMKRVAMEYGVTFPLVED